MKKAHWINLRRTLSWLHSECGYTLEDINHEYKRWENDQQIERCPKCGFYNFKPDLPLDEGHG